MLALGQIHPSAKEEQGWNTASLLPMRVLFYLSRVLSAEFPPLPLSWARGVYPLGHTPPVGLEVWVGRGHCA